MATFFNALWKYMLMVLSSLTCYSIEKCLNNCSGYYGCFDSLLPVTQNLDIEDLCLRNSSSRVSNYTSIKKVAFNVLVKQIPILQIGSSLHQNANISLLNCSRQGIIITSSKSMSIRFEIQKKKSTLFSAYSDGMCNMLISGSNDSCRFLIQMEVNAYEHTCFFGNTCSSNGLCFFNRSSNTYGCECCDGFEGRVCEENCSLNGCHINVTEECIDIGGNYSCICNGGYEGTPCLPAYVSENCSINVNGCSIIENNCTQGLLVDSTAGYKCKCHRGWFGWNCDMQDEKCALKSCVNYLSCKNINASLGYECECEAGFTGVNCSIDIDDCANNLCQNGASCNDMVNSYYCTCAPGYKGDFCESKVDMCSLNPCLHNGICLNYNDAYVCVCPSGYTGHNCSIVIDQCFSSPCLNNGVCIRKLNEYHCECKVHFSGKRCEISRDFCSSFPCLNKGECFNDLPNGSFQCSCLPLYSGTKCEINLANPCDGVKCGSNQICVSHHDTYSCQCMFGFAGTNCNEYRCPCSENGRCVRSSASLPYKCKCVNGYGGERCEFHTGDCKTSPSNNCLVDDLCEFLPGYGYTCICPLHLMGKRCDESSSCAYSPCQNGGICIEDSFKKPHCTCSPGFTGMFCQFDMNECLSSPCLNNGLCAEDSINSYKCYCQQGFSGVNCMERVPDASSIDILVGVTSDSTLITVSSIHRYSSTQTQMVIPIHSVILAVSSSILNSPISSNSTSFMLSSNILPESSFSSTLSSSNLSGELEFSATQALHTLHSNYTLLSVSLTLPVHTRQGKTISTEGSHGILTQSLFSSTNASSTEILVGATSYFIEIDLSSTLQYLITETRMVKPFHSFIKATSSYIKSPISSKDKSFILSLNSFSVDTSRNTFSSNKIQEVTRHLSWEIFISSVLTLNTLDKNPISGMSSLLRTMPILTRKLYMTSSAESSYEASSIKVIVETTSHSPLGNFSSILQYSSTQKQLIKSVDSAMQLTSLSISNSPIYFNNMSFVMSSNRFNEGSRSSRKLPMVTLPLSQEVDVDTVQASSALNMISTLRMVSMFQTMPVSTSLYMSSSIKSIYDIHTKSSFSSTDFQVTAIPTSYPSSTPHPNMNLTCADTPCNGYPCLDKIGSGELFLCLCQYPAINPRCLTGVNFTYPYFNGYSYMELRAKIDSTIHNVSLTLRTVSKNGLLLSGFHYSFEYFFQLSIINGYIALAFNMGLSHVYINSSETVNSGRLFSLRMSFDNIRGILSLKVENQRTISKMVEGKFGNLQLASSWYIGGLPLAMASKDYFNFSGCIKDLFINGKQYQLNDSKEMLNWTSISDCNLPACERGVCYNNASCIPHVENRNNYTCKCSSGFEGNNCKQRSKPCTSNECHGGICVWFPNHHKCLCRYGRSGLTCSNNIDVIIPKFEVLANFSSYIEYPWLSTGKYALEVFEIKFHFRMNDNKPLENGLMVFMSASTVGLTGDDFFAIGIIENHMYLVYNLGSGLVEIKSIKPLAEEFKWHFLAAGRFRQYGYLQIDGQEKVMGRSLGDSFELNVKSPLYIGGVPNFVNLPGEVNAFFTQGFSGVIHGIAVRSDNYVFTSLLTVMNPNKYGSSGIPVESGLNIKNDQLNCTLHPCENNGTCIERGGMFECICKSPYKGMFCLNADIPCVDYNPCRQGSFCRVDDFTVKCDCPLGWSGIYCMEELHVSIPYLKETSFLEVPKLNIRFNTTIKISFRSDEENGLLFYTSYSINSNQGDFFAISLMSRFVCLKFNLGTHTASMKTRSKIELGQFHSFKVIREGKSAVMQLDENVPVGIKSSGSSVMLDVNSNFYLGGYPIKSSLNKGFVSDVETQNSFTGCISNFHINGYTYQLNSSNGALLGRNVGDCSGSCKNHHCRNGGKCISSGIGNFSCKCALGKIGKTCNEDTRSFTSAYFGADSYWFTRIPPLDVLGKYHFEITFNTKDDGLLYWHGKLNDPKSDFIALGVKEGSLEIMFSISGNKSAAKIDDNMHDNLNHTFTISRNISTDMVTVQKLNSDGYIFIGGLPGNVSIISGGRFKSGFIGCINNVVIGNNREYIDFSKKSNARGFNVKYCR